MLSPGQSGKKDWQDKETWPFSEPGLLLWDMNQRDWGVFVCLVGGGQEINTGEAGIGEWMKVLATEPYKDWQVYVSDQLFDEEYQRKNSENKSLQDYCDEFSSQRRLCTDEVFTTLCIPISFGLNGRKVVSWFLLKGNKMKI